MPGARRSSRARGGADGAVAALLGILHEAQLTGDWRRMKGCRQCELRVLRPLEEPLGGLVRDVDLREPHEEPRVLPAARGAMSDVGARRDVARARGGAGARRLAAALPLVLGGDSAALRASRCWRRPT